MPVPSAGPDEPADAGDPSSAAHPRAHRRRGRARTVLLIVALVLLVTAALGFVAARVTMSAYDRAVARDVLLDPDARATTPGAAVRGPLNFLLLGSDRRKSNPDMGQRSDTIIIAHITRDLDHAYLLSIPRDLLVEIPAQPDIGFPGAYTKINAAYGYGRSARGGARLVARTLTRLTGVRFDGAAVIDFSGLRSAVTVLGGVRMCVDVRTVSIHTGAVFEKGCRRMNSAQVLDYLRQRDSLPDGDFGRQRHQQQFIKAIAAEARRQSLLVHPIKLDRLIRSVAASLVVDIGAVSLPDLLLALRGIDDRSLTGIRLPAYDDMIDNISYVVAERPRAHDLFDAVRTDTLAAWAAANRSWVNRI
ncbi:hypothetical protein GCM10009682_05450 [Luedemannella flava]|uniref:Cell envelope-related transcriptional attenuator domain-containing protein n=1 Tax=Luedemannella flava TaxID=349316 RepID=A0ABP4XP01_9ACTN